MRASNYWLHTQKTVTQEAVASSHRLMLRAGLIRAAGSGSYTWLPTGMRVLNKLTRCVHRMMGSLGGLELQLPQLQTAQLWEYSGRLEKYGPELFRLKDRQGKAMILAPTHEEFITEVTKGSFIKSRSLPRIFYQIQNKFRDEKRPRAGVIRAKEFLMKDAYSFHASETSLEETYERISKAYEDFFQSLGLNFVTVKADPGQIGGGDSHEFHALLPVGEDKLAASSDGSYLAKLEEMPILPSGAPESEALQASPHMVEGYSFGEADSKQKQCFLLFSEGDRPSPMKLSKLHQSSEKEWELSSPQRLPLKSLPEALLAYQEEGRTLYADKALLAPLSELLSETPSLSLQFADLRYAQTGDLAPNGSGPIEVLHGMEIAHIFKLGSTYSQLFSSLTPPKEGASPLIMGCYGIGISRLMAAVIEQHHDSKGLRWPEGLAPFEVAILPLHTHKSPLLKETAEKVYQELEKSGLEVLYDDREERAGVALSDIELLGIPHLIVLGSRFLETGHVEYRLRTSKEETSTEWALPELLAHLKQRGQRN